MQSYDVLFFDLDHTLIDTRGQYVLAVDATVKQMVSDDEVPHDFTERFMRNHDRLWPHYDKREISMAELRRRRYLLTWKEYGVDKSIDEADAFQTAYDETFESTLHAFPGIAEMLTELAAKYRLGIITNGAPDLQWRKTKIVGFDCFFAEQHLIISEQIGHAKPHPSVYQAACERLHVEPGQALMIGDNYRGDVLGAREAGLDAIWFGPDESIIKPQLSLTSEAPLRTPAELLNRIAELEAKR